MAYTYTGKYAERQQVFQHVVDWEKTKELLDPLDREIAEYYWGIGKEEPMSQTDMAERLLITLPPKTLSRVTINTRIGKIMQKLVPKKGKKLTRLTD